MRRILVGIDGSDELVRAAEWAAELAKAFDGVEVIAVSIYGLDPAASAYGAAYLTTDFWEQWRSELQRNLDGDWTKPFRESGVKLATIVEEGDAGEVLLRLAREKQANLVVVGSRGRGHLRGMFLGSVSHALALHAPCPVVIFPHHHTSASGAEA